MSPLAGSLENTATTVVSVATTTTVNTTVTTLASTEQSNTSNLFGIPSTAVLTTMMMANPFDETFKQAVLRQQKKDINLIENNFNNNNNNNNDDELNTPFIASTNVLDVTKNTNSSKYWIIWLDLRTSRHKVFYKHFKIYKTSKFCIYPVHYYKYYLYIDL